MSTDKVTQAQAFDALSVLVSYTPSEQSPTDAREALLDFIAQHPDEPAKPATLYDWSDPRIPAWVQWIATDSGGPAWGYSERPILLYRWDSAELGTRAARIYGLDAQCDFADSLEQRPQS